MGRDGSRRSLDNLEKRLTSMLAGETCKLCATRTGACPECGRPVGPFQGQAAEIRQQLEERLTRYWQHQGRIAMAAVDDD